MARIERIDRGASEKAHEVGESEALIQTRALFAGTANSTSDISLGQLSAHGVRVIDSLFDVETDRRRAPVAGESFAVLMRKVSALMGHTNTTRQSVCPAACHSFKLPATYSG